MLNKGLFAKYSTSPQNKFLAYKRNVVLAESGTQSSFDQFYEEQFINPWRE